MAPCTRWKFDNSFIEESIVSNWNLVCDSRWALHASMVTFIASSVIVMPRAGIISDRMGRRPVICMSFAVLLCAGCLVSTSTSFLHFTLLRSVVSASADVLLAALLILQFEVNSPARRTILTMAAYVTGALLGPCFVHLITMVKLHWATMNLIVMVPTSMLACTYFLQESPSWLLATWNMRSAEGVVVRAAAINGIGLETALHSFKKLEHGVMLRATMDSGNAGLPGLEQEGSAISNAMSCYMCWFTLQFAYHSVWPKTSTGTTSLDLIHLAAKIPLFVVAYTSMLRYGQRWTLGIIMICLFYGITALAILYSYKFTAVHQAVLPLVKAICGMAIVVNTLYTLDLYPTTARARLFGMAFGTGQLGALLTSFSYQIDNVNVTTTILLASAVLLLASLSAVRRLPEVMPDRRLAAIQITTTDRKAILVASLALSPDTSPRQLSAEKRRVRLPPMVGRGRREFREGPELRTTSYDDPYKSQTRTPSTLSPSDRVTRSSAHTSLRYPLSPTLDE